MEKVGLFSLNSTYNEWMNKLLFYRDDIKIMQNRLGEVATKNNSIEVVSLVEHLQNQYILQNDRIDDLIHKVKQGAKAIENDINSNPVASDHRKVGDNTSLRDEVEVFEKIFNDLRKESIHFFSKWM